jgi:hypothetical protein
MSGFLWKYSKEYMGDLEWKLSISTTRRCYGNWWDEEISAIYVNGPHAGQPVQISRDQLSDSLEKITLVSKLGEGELIAVYKDTMLARYSLIVKGHIVALDADFEPAVNKYVSQVLSVDWLLSQEDAA